VAVAIDRCLRMPGRLSVRFLSSAGAYYAIEKPSLAARVAVERRLLRFLPERRR
jgi:hypothetical protein